MTLGCDVWSDVCGDSIINFVALSNQKSYLIDSVHSEDNSHTANYYTEKVTAIFERFPHRFVGLVTDNTTTNISLWNILKVNHKDKFFYGCSCHVYHLLVKDIFILPNSYKNSEIVFPLNDFVELKIQCSQIVNVLNKGLQTRSLKKNQQLLGLRSLKIHGETRWGSLFRMFSEIKNWLDPVLFPLFDNLEWSRKGTIKLIEWKNQMRDIIHTEKFTNTLTNAI